MELICCSSPPEFDRAVFNYWFLAHYSLIHYLSYSLLHSLNKSVLLTYLLPLYSFNQSLACLHLNLLVHKFNFLRLFSLYRCEGKNVEIVADLLISGNAFVGLADDEATSGTIYTHSNRHPHM